jgi:hypothetical protein
MDEEKSDGDAQEAEECVILQGTRSAREKSSCSGPESAATATGGHSACVSVCGVCVASFVCMRNNIVSSELINIRTITPPLPRSRLSTPGGQQRAWEARQKMQKKKEHSPIQHVRGLGGPRHSRRSRHFRCEAMPAPMSPARRYAVGSKTKA